MKRQVSRRGLGKALCSKEREQRSSKTRKGAERERGWGRQREEDFRASREPESPPVGENMPLLRVSHPSTLTVNTHGFVSLNSHNTIDVLGNLPSSYPGPGAPNTSSSRALTAEVEIERGGQRFARTVPGQCVYVLQT